MSSTTPASPAINPATQGTIAKAETSMTSAPLRSRRASQRSNDATAAGSSPHFPPDRFGDAAHLTGNKDPEPVLIVVAAIAFVGMDAADFNPSKPFEIGDRRAEVVPQLG